MSKSDERFVVRPPFWPLFVRAGLTFQGVMTAVLFVSFVTRVAGGTQLFLPGDPALLATVYGQGTLLTILSAASRWLGSRALLSVEGIYRTHPLWRRRKDPYIYWSRVELVQRRRSWWLGRWLRVVSEYGEAINLPERPADFDGFREAVERFAGSDHPLARALAEIAEEG